MKFRNLLAATAALSLAASPALAETSARVSAPVAQDESNVEGGSGLIIAILAAAAVIAGIVIIADDGDEDPISA